MNIPDLKHRIEAIYGQEIKYVKDCDALAREISEKTARNISASTVKRLLGFIRTSGNPGLYTLDTVSRYLGFDSWQEFSGRETEVHLPPVDNSNAVSLTEDIRPSNHSRKLSWLGFSVLVTALICGWAYFPFSSEELNALKNLPEPRNAGRAIISNNTIYYLGGSDAEYVRNSTWLYDTNKDNWIVKAAMPTARGEFAAALVNDKIYCFGGWLGNSIGETNAAEVYDVGADVWDTLSSMPMKMTSANAVTVGADIFILGGTTGTTRTHFIRFDTQSNTYEDLPAPGIHRMYCAMVAKDGLIYAIGGNSFSGGEYKWHNEFSCYNPKTRSWTELSPLPMPITRSCAALNGDFIHVAGGSDGYGNDNAAIKDWHYVYDTKANEWREKERLPFKVSAHQLVFYKERLLILGGTSQFPNPSRQFFAVN